MVWDTWLWFTTVNAMYRELNPSRRVPASSPAVVARKTRRHKEANQKRAVYKGSATAMVPHATRWSLKGAKTWVP